MHPIGKKKSGELFKAYDNINKMEVAIKIKYIDLNYIS